MARFHLLVAVVAVVALACAAYAATDFSAKVKAVEKEGDALPDLLQKGWTARLAAQKQNLSTAEKSLTQKLTGDEKTGVADALKELEKVLVTVNTNLTSFVKLQNTDAKKIAKSYDQLLNARVKASGSAATSEAEIHQLRSDSQKTVNSWVPRLGQINADAHQVFQSAIDSAAAAAFKKSGGLTPAKGSAQAANRAANNAAAASKAAQADRVRVAVIQVGVGLLNALVQEQNASIALLTSTQFGLYNDFFSKAETVLIEMMVQAKIAAGQKGGSGQAQKGATGGAPTAKSTAPVKHAPAKTKPTKVVADTKAKPAKVTPTKV